MCSVPDYLRWSILLQRTVSKYMNLFKNNQEMQLFLKGQMSINGFKEDSFSPTTLEETGGHGVFSV